MALSSALELSSVRSLSLPQAADSIQAAASPSGVDAGVVFATGLTLADIEKVVILETLKRQNFNRTRAARVLGIGIRTLQRKLKQYRSDFGELALADA